MDSEYKGWHPACGVGAARTAAGSAVKNLCRGLLVSRLHASAGCSNGARAALTAALEGCLALQGCCCNAAAAEGATTPRPLTFAGVSGKSLRCGSAACTVSSAGWAAPGGNRERSRRHARAAAQHHSTHARQPPAARSWSQRISNTASRRSNTARSRSNTASRRSGGSRRSSCTL